MRIPASLPVPNKEEMWQVLDSTKLQSFASCPRSYFFEYVLGWRNDRPSNHLVFGSAWHKALEYLYKNGLKMENVAPAYDQFIEVYRRDWPESTDDWFGGKTPEAALKALVQYISKYASDVYKYKVLATEVVDRLPLNPDQEIVVKLDAVLQDVDTEKIYILEHKTGSSAGQWWARQWHLSLQVGAYIAACNYFYDREETPAIIDGAFFLKSKCAFNREIVMRDTRSLSAWYNSVSSIIEGIEREFSVLSLDDPKEVVQKSFPQNPVSCEKYGGCQFYDLCLGVANPLSLAQESMPPIGFKEEWWNPLTA